MATYNAAQYLGQQIQSIIDQSYTEWTLYIRDDGSKDSTIEIIKQYETLDHRIIRLQDEKGNLGCKGNFFEMLKRVESQYYAFSDADDVWFPDKIEKTLNMIKEIEKQHPNTAVAIHTDLVVTDSDLNIISPSMWRASHMNPDKIHSYDYLGVHSFVGGATMLFNYLARQICLPVNEHVYMHDLWVGLCVIKNGVLYSLHEPTMYYRQHGGNTVGGASEARLKLGYKIRHIKDVIKINWQTARMLKQIGYGSYLKYLYYKIRVIIKLRRGHMFD